MSARRAKIGFICIWLMFSVDNNDTQHPQKGSKCRMLTLLFVRRWAFNETLCIVNRLYFFASVVVQFVKKIIPPRGNTTSYVSYRWIQTLMVEKPKTCQLRAKVLFRFVWRLACFLARKSSTELIPGNQQCKTLNCSETCLQWLLGATRQISWGCISTKVIFS